MTTHNLIRQLRAVACAIIPDSETDTDLAHAVHTDIVKYLKRYEEDFEHNGSLSSIPYIPSDDWGKCDPTPNEAVLVESELLLLISLVSSINAETGNKLLQVEYSLSCIRNQIGYVTTFDPVTGEQPEFELKVFNDDDPEDQTFDCIRCGDTRTKDEYYSYNVCAYCAHVTR